MTSFIYYLGYIKLIKKKLIMNNNDKITSVIKPKFLLTISDEDIRGAKRATNITQGAVASVFIPETPDQVNTSNIDLRDGRSISWLTEEWVSPPKDRILPTVKQSIGWRENIWFLLAISDEDIRATPKNKIES